MLVRTATTAATVVSHAGRFAARAAWWSVTGRRRRVADLAGRALADLCEALGPAYIKLAQAASTRPDLLPAPVVAALARLQDDVAPFDGRAAAATVESAFGRPIAELFVTFQERPVASASIAQVHRATLADGRTVAVKVRRPGIVPRVEADLALWRAAARLLACVPGLRDLPWPELVEEVGRPVHDQLNFLAEAENNRLFRSQFADAEGVRFPALVEELCGESVLTMEFIEPLTRVTSTEMADADRKAAARTGLRTLYAMIFVHGHVHADMHPGNVFVGPWGLFVILDTGLVARLDDADRRDFVDFFFGIVNNDGRLCARIIEGTATSRNPRRYDGRAFEAAMAELVGRYAALRSREFEVTRFVWELVALQRRFGIRGSMKFMTTIMAMVVFDGICKQLDPGCDFQAEARGFLIAARYRRPASAGGPALLAQANRPGLPVSPAMPPTLRTT